MIRRLVDAVMEWFYGPYRQALSPDLVPRELSMPRADALPPLPPMQQQRHVDPGPTFDPQPAARTDLGILPVRSGLLVISAPPGADGQISFQLANGDWTPWRPAKSMDSNSVPAIAARWRLRGAP